MIHSFYKAKGKRLKAIEKRVVPDLTFVYTIDPLILVFFWLESYRIL